MPRRPQSLESRVVALERKVAALEGGGAGRRARTSTQRALSPLDLLQALAERKGARYEHGALAYAGLVALEGREYRWAREHGVSELARDDWAPLAPVLACLGSPVRLSLLRALLEGPRDRQALQATLGEATSGQLYHHLRDLQAARLVVQRARGSYELPPAAVVPVFTILAAAQDLAMTDEARAVEP